MSQQLIRIWLGLPPECDWPPDHYKLLGLKPGESDLDAIEQQVHQRLETVRRYQLIHPEQATEAMNRLAQAFVCLSDPGSKKSYDTALLPQPGGSRWVVVNHSAAPPALLVEDVTVVIPADAGTEEHLSQAQVDTKIESPTPAAPGEIPIVAEPPRSVPATEAAPPSAAARRGLSTKRAIYKRVAQTRRLLRSWEGAGRYLGDPARRVARPAEATELIEHLTTVRLLLRGFPPVLGVAGQPGYLVASLARQQVIVPTFQTLLPSQREALARDWEAGRQQLAEHRQFLRQELRAMRQRSPVARALRAVVGVLSDQPGMILLLLALLALNVALWKQVRSSTWLSLLPSRTSAPSHR